jgi:hypothetical protein
MTTSKFIRIDKNVLLEYIYDESNLVGESYSIIFNENTLTNSFISSNISTNNYIVRKDVFVGNNTQSKLFSNQLVSLNREQDNYGRLDFESYSFIQKRDFGTSAPIRYDKLRIWFPTNWTFDDFKGFHTRIYTLDANGKFVNLSNYFFNISDPNQINELEYMNPFFIWGESQWGKYIQIQFPSPAKVADQKRRNTVRENTINFNLTEGVGLSKNSPIFIDFLFIKSVRFVNGLPYYSLTQKRNVSFSQTPEFEKFGVVIEKASLGDYFLIYPIYNSSIGEFNKFIEDSILNGNRYYLEYQIDILEKNLNTSSQKIVVTENFIEEIEFRPILKWTTTTAIIDVSCKLIDAVDGSAIERKASYAMIQEEVSNFSRFLSKIDMSKADRIEVHKIKSNFAPNLDSNNNLTLRSKLEIIPVSFVVFSNIHHLVTDTINAQFNNLEYKGFRQETIVLNPNDNIFKFDIIKPDSQSDFVNVNLTEYENIRLTFRNDKKTLDFDIYFDSDENNLELGLVVFKVASDKYSEIKKIYLSGFSNFYINGDINGSKEVIYTGIFLPWDVQTNINRLDLDFESNKNITTIKNKLKNSITESRLIENVKQNVIQNLQKPTSVNLDSLNLTDSRRFNLNPNTSNSEILKSSEESIFNFWTPYWKGNYQVMLRSYEYGFEKNTTNATNKWVLPNNIRDFALKCKDYGIIQTIEVDILTGKLTGQTQKSVDDILSYFKIFNFNPNDVDIVDYVFNLDDIKNYLLSDISKLNVIVGSNVPPNKDIVDYINRYLSIKNQIDNSPKFKRRK